MDSPERVFFLDYLVMLRKWWSADVSAKEMNRRLNWTDRKMKCSIVVPRKTLRLGDTPRVAFVLHNASDKPMALFPFVKVRLSDRGHKQDGTRTDMVAFNESPSHASYLYLVRPGDTVVVPAELDCQPTGVYRARITVNLGKFMKQAEMRGCSMSPVAIRTVEFKILPPEK